MIKEVHIFENGNTMVFDERGEQMSKYQSSYKTPRDERHQVILDASPSTIFYKSVWGGHKTPISRQRFIKLLDIEPEWCKQKGSTDVAR